MIVDSRQVVIVWLALARLVAATARRRDVWHSALKGGKTMDWSTVLSTVAIIVFIVLMMRGCGGMMAGGGCGMGRPRRRDHANSPASAPPDEARRS